jgi:hypothetical protein
MIDGDTMTIQAKVFSGHSSGKEPGWLRLMSAVFAQAVRDAKGGDLLKSLDAVLWLSGPDAEMYLDAVGFPADPLLLLTSGQARKAKAERKVKNGKYRS